MPLVQAHVYGSMNPVGGCLPWLHAGVSESMALRAGGMIIEAWPLTSGAIHITNIVLPTTCDSRYWDLRAQQDSSGSVALQHPC